MEAQADPRPNVAKGLMQAPSSTWFIGMSDPDSDPDRTQQLRSEAAARLNDAAQCSDPALRDDLVSEALALLAEARALRDQAGRDVGAPATPTRMQ